MNKRAKQTSDTLRQIKDTLVACDVDAMEHLVRDALVNHVPAAAILQTLKDGMLVVSQKYDAQEYYLPELVLAGDGMTGAVSLLKPYLKAGVTGTGKVIIATVKGDLHDIGKNILSTLLTAAGFDVIDLGKDVPAEKIVEATKAEHADIIALSALLTMTVGEIAHVVQKLQEAGLRNHVTILCGGAPVNPALAKRLGADLSCDDATEAIQVCRYIMDKKKQ